VARLAFFRLGIQKPATERFSAAAGENRVKDKVRSGDRYLLYRRWLDFFSEIAATLAFALRFFLITIPREECLETSDGGSALAAHAAASGRRLLRFTGEESDIINAIQMGLFNIVFISWYVTGAAHRCCYVT
jgi:hypothetical protein